MTFQARRQQGRERLLPRRAIGFGHCGRGRDAIHERKRRSQLVDQLLGELTLPQRRRRRSRAVSRRSQRDLQPYTLAISVFNLGDAVGEFVEAMAPHRGRVYVIDDKSTDNTAYHLENAGMQVIRGGP